MTDVTADQKAEAPARPSAASTAVACNGDVARRSCRAPPASSLRSGGDGHGRRRSGWHRRWHRSGLGQPSGALVPWAIATSAPANDPPRTDYQTQTIKRRELCGRAGPMMSLWPVFFAPIPVSSWSWATPSHLCWIPFWSGMTGKSRRPPPISTSAEVPGPGRGAERRRHRHPLAASSTGAGTLNQNWSDNGLRQPGLDDGHPRRGAQPDHRQLRSGCQRPGRQPERSAHRGSPGRTPSALLAALLNPKNFSWFRRARSPTNPPPSLATPICRPCRPPPTPSRKPWAAKPPTCP